MAVTIGIPKETVDGETRVAITPQVAARLEEEGVELIVESGAGARAYHDDAEYEEAGVQIAARSEVWEADVLAKVHAPTPEEIDSVGEGTLVVGFLDPLNSPEGIQRLAERGVSAISMEMVPRISRAQSMDALSAMSTIGGYKAVLQAADALPKFFPLLTTAAGTIRPADTVVLGAGVAGLQAIATARRLGARVKGYDIREATREQVESLGADFIELEVEMDEETETEGGYAKELDEKKKEQQPELLRPHLAEADVVVTTALIPGRPAPVLITEETVEEMDPGSVIMDLAAPNGGNCALTEPGESIRRHGVRIDGPTNLPAEMPRHASQMYAKTLSAMIGALIEEGELEVDLEDEIFDEACVVFEGEIRSERVRDSL